MSKTARHSAAAFLYSTLVLGFAGSAMAQTTEAPIFHVWQNDTRKAQIEIGRCPGATGPVRGKIVRLLEPKKDDGSPGTQEEATDPCDRKAGRQARKLLGMAVLVGYQLAADGRAITGGKAYNVEECDTFSVDARLSGDGRTLELRHRVLPVSRTWTLVR